METLTISKQEDIDQYLNKSSDLVIPCSVHFATEANVIGSLVVAGYLEADYDVLVGKSIITDKFIRAKGCILAGEQIKADGSVRAYERIEANGNIDCVGAIEADDDIKSKGHLHTRSYIKSGAQIVVGGDISAAYFISAVQSIAAEGDITTKGRIAAGCEIVAGKNIYAGNGLKSSYYVAADGDITVLGKIQAEYIVAEGHIYCTSDILSLDTISAGGAIISGGYVLPLSFSLTCKTLKTKTLPFDRNYYASIPCLAPIREVIVDDNKCWSEIKEAALPYADEIVAWNGWNPVILAQIKMFLGLVETVAGKEIQGDTE